MEVKLAGYNVDADILEEMRLNQEDSSPAAMYSELTPETLSAAYARISRDPAPVGELRRQARQDVAEARKSNRTIVFEYGHASVAEHAVLNFDITGLSRLAIEALEHARLCSYTEKSQRYQKLKDDYVMPGELGPWKEDFHAIVAFQNEAYQQAYKAISAHLKKTMPHLEPAKRRGKAKEDARYLTSLAMEGQLGMTLNARNLEAMVRRLASHPLAEVRDLAVKLHSEGVKVAPSLLIYTGADPMRCDAPREIARAGWPATAEIRKHEPEQPADVRIVNVSGSTNLVTAALMHENCHAGFGRCFGIASDDAEVEPKVFRAVFAHMGAHSAVPRAFELQQFTFELTMSASCFAQMKRHRMATILPQGYEPTLSPKMPPSFAEAGLEDLFRKVTSLSAHLATQIAGSVPAAAPYALTQAHRRRVIASMNAREMYAFSRLRMDGHAQWEIREIAKEMVRLAQEASPMLMAMACGKDEFDDRKRKVMEALDGPDPYVSIRKI